MISVNEWSGPDWWVGKLIQCVQDLSTRGTNPAFFLHRPGSYHATYFPVFHNPGELIVYCRRKDFLIFDDFRFMRYGWQGTWGFFPLGMACNRKIDQAFSDANTQNGSSNLAPIQSTGNLVGRCYEMRQCLFCNRHLYICFFAFCELGWSKNDWPASIRDRSAVKRKLMLLIASIESFLFCWSA